MLDFRQSTAGVLISVYPSVMQPSDHLSFWESARKFKQGMRDLQTKEAFTRGLSAVREVVQREGDPDDLSTIDPRGFYNHDLLISNYGDPGVRTDFGHLELKAVYPAVITGDIDTQSVSALTVNGALHMTHISRRPFPSFLEQTCSILCDASRVISMAAD
jgi:hypothetical protein